jgi:hypothetical protein
MVFNSHELQTALHDSLGARHVRLGHLLVQDKVITPDQLAEAVEIQ